MRPSQQRAVNQFRNFMERQLNPNPEYGDTLVEFEVKPTDYGTFWITARTDMTKLSPNSMLRCLDAQHWFVSVGRHGSLTVKMCPKSFHQFNITRGSRRNAFGMTFDTTR